MSTSSDNEGASIGLIADLIAHVARAGFEDWSIINQICDLSISSETCALQANLTLTEELLATTTDHRLMRVARLWAIMLRNGGELFIEYNASSSSGFLQAVEGVISRGSDSGAGARLLRVLGSAVYDFAGTNAMHPYAILWVSVKHPGQPSLGLRIPDTDALLRPTNTTSPLKSTSYSPMRAAPTVVTTTSSDPPDPPATLIPSSVPSISVQNARVPIPQWDPYNNRRPEASHTEDQPGSRFRKEITFDSGKYSNSQAKSSGLRLPSFTSVPPVLSQPEGSEIISLPYSESDDPTSEPASFLQKPRKRSFRKSMVDSIRSSLDKVLIKDSEPLGGNDEPLDSAANPELPSFPTNSMSYAPPPMSTIPISPSESPTSSTPSDVFSVVHSGLGGKMTLNMSITDLCAHIRASPLAKDSHITSLIWNKEQSGVKHEFLLIQVVSGVPTSPASSSSDSEKREVTSWLRLDRAAQKGYRGLRSLSLRSSSAVFPANDTAMISGNKTALIGETSKIQANVEFRTPPTLLDLATLLTVVCEESAEYDLFKENCYFFCSVIQQVLSELHVGHVEYGKPLHLTLGADARRRIRDRLRQHSVPWTMPNP